MNSQTPIILASHGAFAAGALSCAEMLMGKQDGIAILAIQQESNIEQIRQQLLRDYQRLNQGQGVLILVDLMGGTPCNLASELALIQQDIMIYCGFNIPVLLEVLNNRELSFQQLRDLIDEVYPQSCFNVNPALVNLANQQQDIDL